MISFFIDFIYKILSYKKRYTLRRSRFSLLTSHFLNRSTRNTSPASIRPIHRQFQERIRIEQILAKSPEPSAFQRFGPEARFRILPQFYLDIIYHLRFKAHLFCQHGVSGRRGRKTQRSFQPGQHIAVQAHERGNRIAGQGEHHTAFAEGSEPERFAWAAAALCESAFVRPCLRALAGCSRICP